MSDPGSTGASERNVTIDRAREEWIRKLIDLSRRNNLLYFRDLKVGTLDVTNADQEALARLFRGDSVQIRTLFDPEDVSRAAAVALTIARKAQSNLDEKGLETLFLAVGMVTWPADDGGRDPEAAVLLQPVALLQRSRDRSQLSIALAGEPQLNLTLMHVLQERFGAALNEGAVLSRANVVDAGLDPVGALGEFERQVATIEGLRVLRRFVLGNFSFQKLSMVKDLRELRDAMVKHEMIAAIAGDPQARSRIGARHADVDPRHLDGIPADREFLVLDADPSQQCAILSVHSGDNLVIQGPPGTGKSQTIANLIGALAAAGKRVLFVAEKRAALEVVQNRLKRLGLGHLCLDLHGATITRKEVLARVADALDKVRGSLPAVAELLHGNFEVRRRQLNDHTQRLHARRDVGEQSVYQMIGRLSRLASGTQCVIRFRGTQLRNMNRAHVALVIDALVQLAQYGPLVAGTSNSPWRDARLSTPDDAQGAIDAATRLHSEGLPNLYRILETLCTEQDFRQPASVTETQSLLALLERIAQICDAYPGSLFKENLGDIAAALAPAESGVFKLAWHFVFDSRFRQTRRRLLTSRKGKANSRALLSEVRMAGTVLKEWSEWTRGKLAPSSWSRTGELGSAMDQVGDDLRNLGKVLRREDLRRLEPPQLTDVVAHLTQERQSALRIPGMLAALLHLGELGANPVIADAKRRSIPPDLWASEFESAWLSSCIEQALLDEPQLAGFNGGIHGNAVTEFQRTDRERLTAAATRVQRAHGERAIQSMNAHPDQADLVRRESAKRARHLPLRKLVAGAPDVLTAVCPCWLASPLSVSQLLPGDKQYFDVCIFDEASQVLPEDAVTSILRAPQTVVAGDRYQLPPTTFFADGGFAEAGDEVDAETATAGFESVLDVMSAFVPDRMLEWHYRSRDERLIHFSNHHIYQDRLVTFPSASQGTALSHVLVQPQEWREGEQDSVGAEVRAVVDLILQHGRSRPTATLGVITMGIKHAERIQAALDIELQVHPELDEFFSAERPERFFVKNLERVQGDERDEIILTIGYGKDPAGKLLYRFGPLLYEGGERRLNVAITRARDRVTVVSSFSHFDMDASRSRARGVELLRLYLEYAANSGNAFGAGGGTEVPLNDFEADIFETLTAQGLSLEPQWGASQYRIDMVARHPTQPGRFVLAIECDGATYHSSYTARARDRLRQQHLEALGWHFHRIWSMDWFSDQTKEVERVLEAFRRAVGGGSQQPQPVQPKPGVPGNRNSQRGPKPQLRQGASIDDYADHELMQLVQWIKSDGQLRIDDQIVAEAVQELGYKRRGQRINERLRKAIQLARLS